MPRKARPQSPSAKLANAGRSTGPGTPQGKRRSRLNALKHGLLSREVVIATGDGAEEGRDFHTLLRDLEDELKPEGLIEQTPVERIATCYWRLRRAQRYEVGMIRESLDECARATNCSTVEIVGVDFQRGVVALGFLLSKNTHHAEPHQAEHE